MQTLIFLLISCTLLQAVSSFGIARYSFFLRRTRKLFNSNAFNTPEDRYKGLPLERGELKNPFGPLAQIGKDINAVQKEIKGLKKKMKVFEDNKLPKDEFSKQSYLKWQDELTALRNELTALRNKENLLLAKTSAPQQPGK